MARILVVDDEPAHRESLRRIFERAGHVVVCAADGDAAIASLQSEPFDVVLTDLIMPRTDGMAVLRAVRERQPGTDTILMTAYGTVENAVQAMREGAYDFLTKPTRRAELLACLERVLERQRLLSENRVLKAELIAQGNSQAVGLARLLGTSPAMAALKARLQQVAPTTATVLLTGESGTGKELCARALHDLSPRASAAFVAVHCAALPDTLLDVELFGAEKGAFTGADERRLGRFERAHRGTLFLDEIADIPLPMQVKLLRALQEGEVERLGGQAAVPVDVRVVAATNVDLAQRVKQGRYRVVLYYRLNVVSLDLPPLRARDGDIALLAGAFLQQHSARHHKQIPGIEDRALAALTAWPFPGNVRELSHAVERAVVLCPPEAPLRLEDLPPVIAAAARDGGGSAEVLRFVVGQTTLAQMERAAVDATLKAAAGDKVLAAKLLGVSLRTLYRRLDEKPADAFAPDGEATGDDGHERDAEPGDGDPAGRRP